MTFNFDKCPRCLDDWTNKVGLHDPYLHCKRCDCSYWENKPKMFVIFNFLKDGDQVVWEWKNGILKSCYYLGVNSSRYIQLGWLPLDVNTNKLKLLLVFS